MEIIQITPAELRIAAVVMREESEFLCDAVALAGESAEKVAEAYRITAGKFSKLAEKLEADKLDAMTFCIPGKGVQA